MLYNIGISAYRFGVGIASRFNSKARKMIDGRKLTTDTLRRALKPGDRPIWIHAASLGEFEQGRPLIERLRRDYPEKPIVLTFFSPSGYEIRKNYPKVDVVAYLPFDTPRRVEQFLELVNPAMAIFVKYEFWANYLFALRRRNIPTYIISAIFRQEQIFFRPWGGFFRDVLGCFTHIFVQDDDSAKLLAEIGIDNVTVAGDTRFDRVTDIMASQPAIPGASLLKPFLIVGSSWPADEEHYIPWLNAHPEVSFIIAPHEFDSRRIDNLVKAISGNVIRYSDWEKANDPIRRKPGDLPVTAPRGIIVDCFGKLSALYRLARVAYIGGGFGVGIHNINEAAVYDIPVVFGPAYAKFKEARDLISLGGATSVSDIPSLERILDLYLNDPEQRLARGRICGDYIRQNIGATDRILPFLTQNL